jgi:hypothetical protein
MSVPAVNINRLDNQLGVTPPQTGDTMALVGNCSSGPLDTPGLYYRPEDIQSTFGQGPLVEAACYELEWTGRPVVLCRTATTTVGGYGTVDVTDVAGTSVVTTNAATEPYDDFEAYIEIVVGGTIGVAGITYRWSLDGGRTMSAITALGTSTNITLAGNVRFNLAAGTLLAGDSWKCRTSAPKWNTAQLSAALTALRNSLETFQQCQIVGPVAGDADVVAIQAAAVAFEAVGKEVAFIWNTRVPNIGESETAYKTAMDTAFGASVSKFSIPCAGGCEMQSPISQRQYLRPISMSVAARLVDVRPGQDIAEKSLGPLPGVRIVDAARNPKHHDERLFPGLDDSRFTTLRSWANSPGAYVNNCRVLSTPGSDYQFGQHLRVINVACDIARRVLELRSSADLIVSSSTGFIVEDEASDIDTAVDHELDELLVKTRNASAAKFILNRSDNLLSTFRLKGKVRVTPLGYVKFFDVDVGFYNPALTIVEV